MAGWVNSTGVGAGTGTARGAGGRGFTNRRYSGDTVQGGSSSGGGRWRGERPRGRPPPQPHYQYRPVDAAHRHSPPSTGPALSEQAASSTSTRRAQITHPSSATDKSSASVAVAPAGTNKEPDDKGTRNAANFECNVCFDMAAEPVVTKCGHLFCWECLYQWLHVHSHHRECPVCKGQVADDAIIPIYGRGGSAASVVDNAPPRPTGARVESSRQQQQQHHLHTPYQMVYVDDDEEDDPFDFPSMMNFGLGATSVRDAVRSFMSPSFDDVEMEDQFDDYTYEYRADDFDGVYDYNLLGFPVFSSSGTGAEVANPSSSNPHPQFEYVDIDSMIPGHHREFGYSGVAPHNQNRGRQGRRRSARASADQSSTDAMVTGGSGAFYRDNGASSNVSAGASSSRPNGGWAERRGRSNRNSNSAGGRGGMQDGRRHRTSYS